MKITRILSFFALMCALVFIAGCATPAEPKGMVAKKYPKVDAPRDPVVVSVTGGSKTDPMWTSKIASEDFKKALVDSLEKAGLFRPNNGGGSAPYRLDVRLEVLEQPLMGFDMTVNLRADWKLMRGDQEIWHQPVVSSYTATVGDAFVAITRLRLADEGAARVNIEKGLEKISTLGETKISESK